MIVMPNCSTRAAFEGACTPHPDWVHATSLQQIIDAVNNQRLMVVDVDADIVLSAEWEGENLKIIYIVRGDDGRTHDTYTVYPTSSAGGTNTGPEYIMLPNIASDGDVEAALASIRQAL